MYGKGNLGELVDGFDAVGNVPLVAVAMVETVHMSPIDTSNVNVPSGLIFIIPSFSNNRVDSSSKFECHTCNGFVGTLPF